MRRLLAPLSRWLDRRIDARIATRIAGKPLPAGHQQLAEFATDAIRDASALKRSDNWMGA